MPCLGWAGRQLATKNTRNTKRTFSNRFPPTSFRASSCFLWPSSVFPDLPGCLQVRSERLDVLAEHAAVDVLLAHFEFRLAVERLAGIGADPAVLAVQLGDDFLHLLGKLGGTWLLSQRAAGLGSGEIGFDGVQPRSNLPAVM